MDNHPVDLRRYKQARAEQAQREAARAKSQRGRAGERPAPNGKEPLLGANPRAKLFLAVFVVILLVLWIGPRILR